MPAALSYARRLRACSPRGSRLLFLHRTARRSHAASPGAYAADAGAYTADAMAPEDSAGWGTTPRGHRTHATHAAHIEARRAQIPRRFWPDAPAFSADHIHGRARGRDATRLSLRRPARIGVRRSCCGPTQRRPSSLQASAATSRSATHRTQEPRSRSSSRPRRRPSPSPP